jgi:hypothetical protein
VRTYYLPNQDWQTLRQRGRALREAAGTLTGRSGADVRLLVQHGAADVEHRDDELTLTGRRQEFGRRLPGCRVVARIRVWLESVI